MDRKDNLDSSDEWMTGIYLHEERNLDLADWKKEANEKIRDMVQKWIIETLWKKWIEMVEQNTFVKIKKDINRYTQLVNRLVKLDTDRQLVFQDELDWLSGIINRCYENTDEYFNEVSGTLSKQLHERWKSAFWAIELSPIGARNEEDRPRLITRKIK